MSVGEDYRDSDLPPGSLVVERYEYEARGGGKGVQWLAEVVSKDGLLLFMGAYKTRREALEVAGQHRGGSV